MQATEVLFYSYKKHMFAQEMERNNINGRKCK